MIGVLSLELRLYQFGILSWRWQMSKSSPKSALFAIIGDKKTSKNAQNPNVQVQA